MIRKSLALFVLIIITFVHDAHSAAYLDSYAKSNDTNYPNHCFEHITNQNIPIGLHQLKEFCGKVTCYENFSIEFYR